MAYVRIEQRNARLASAVKLETVRGHDGDLARGVVTIISNTRRGSGQDKTEETTALQWTLWGRQAENAARYLGKGSRVNVAGRMSNNNYDKDGSTVYGYQFTCEELDYLDSKAESEARKERGEWTQAYRQGEAEAQAKSPATRRSTGRPAARSN